MKNSLEFIVLLIWASFSYAQIQNRTSNFFPRDSMMTITLDSIIVVAKREDSSKEVFLDPAVKSFYFGDPQKELTFLPGVISIVPFLSESTIDNLPSQFTGMYFGEDMMIPILGNKTIFQGGASIVNPEFFSLLLEADSYSASYGNIGGIKKMVPKNLSKGISGKVSSDLTDRYISISGKLGYLSSRLGLRQVKVLKPVTELIPELTLLPEVIDFEGNLNFSNEEVFLEGYFLNSIQFQNFKDEGMNHFGIEGIRQDVRHNLYVFVGRYNFEHKIIKFGSSYEYEGQNSCLVFNLGEEEESRFLRNWTFNLEIYDSKDKFRFGLVSYFFKSKELDGKTLRDICNIYGEKEFLIGNFLLNSSISFSYYKGNLANSEAVKMTFFLGKYEFVFSLGNYQTFLFDNSNILGGVLHKKTVDKPNESKQISLSARFNFSCEWMNYIDISTFMKILDVEFSNEGYVKGISKGVRLLAKSDLLNSSLSGYLANSKINGHGITGTIDYDFTYTFTKTLSKNFSLSVQLEARDGIWSKNQTTGIYSRFENAYFLNLGLFYRINLFGGMEINLTGFNLLGKNPELIRYFSGENLISKRAPTWGNLSLSVRF